MIVDIHTHYIPQFVIDEGRTAAGCLGIRVEGDALVYPDGFRHPLTDDFLDTPFKLADMDERRIDVSVLSIAPTLLHYDRDAATAGEFARRANDALAARVADEPRLAGLATVALQDPEGAAAELERAVTELGLGGAQIGNSVGPTQLDDPALEPFYEAADRLAVPLLIHPVAAAVRTGLEDYYLANSVGHLLETTIAAARLIHGGVFDRRPRLRFVLVHGGGFLPYQVGRLDHSYAVRTEPRRSIEREPSSYVDRFFIDTITHGDPALAFLAQVTGDRLVLGTDLPFDMADRRPVERLERVGLDPHVLGETTRQLIPGLAG